MAAACTPTKAPADNMDLWKLYHDVCNPDCSDRGAKLQVFCEQIWDDIHCEPPPNALIDGFVALLLHNDNILIAQLAIPDLRPNASATHTPNPVKQDILERLRLQRPSTFVSPATRRQPSNAEAKRLYMEEKQTLRDADLRQACLLLYGHANVDEAKKEQVRQWLISYPLE